MYYIEKLHLLLDTPNASSNDFTAEQRATAEAASKAEETRLERDPGFAGLEEAKAASTKKDGTTRQGRGATFKVDRSDPNDIVVHMKVRLEKRGQGKKEDVDRTKSLEDAIEMASHARGYTLDLQFVARGGRDVFTVWVDPSEWTNAQNWVGDATAIAHEAHHLLGLEDRYNYIERHAANEDMDIRDRLFWFREQMVRPQDPLADASLMKGAAATKPTMNDEDICSVAGGDYEACLTARFDALPIAEIERRAKILRTPYSQRNAAMIDLLREAWYRHPDRGANCAPNDAACRLPPKESFHDAITVLEDAAEYPLYNPHEPPSGKSDLERTRKPR